MAITSAKQLLLAAAEHIEEYGWTSDTWVDNSSLPVATCPSCAGGAMAVVVTDGRDCSPNFVRPDRGGYLIREACERLVRHLDLPNPNDDMLDAVIRWNDAPERVGNEVVAALRAAAGPGPSEES